MTTAAFQSRFSYQARDQAGQLVSGFVSALTLAEATKALRSEGKYIVDIRPARGTATSELAGPAPTGAASGSVKRDEVINFTIQLSVMVDTGVPLSDALTALSEQSVSPNFSVILKSILTEVTGGKDLSSTLERHPKVFPKYYIALVRASEISGTMGPILRRLADYLVSQRETVKKVRGALIYPAFMFVMCIGVTIFLLTAVLPRFAAIFASRKAALPVPTQIVIAISNGLISYWYVWLAVAVVLAGLGVWWMPTAQGKRGMDWLKLHLPIFGPMFHKLYLSRSLQTIGTMISSGVQVMDCLTVVREVAGNSYYTALWEEVREKIQAGQQLSEPLLKSRLVPKSIAQMIHSVEKTGELPAVMTRLASYLEEDLKTSIKTATQFIEPVMIGLMGLIIGGIAIAMLLPILTISQVMAHG